MLAKHLHGTIINADAMQCCRELRIITAARPPRMGRAFPTRSRAFDPRPNLVASPGGPRLPWPQ
jgi:hypothetical protein